VKEQERKVMVLAACLAALAALVALPAGDTRALVAIDTAQRWAHGLATDAEVEQAEGAAVFARTWYRAKGNEAAVLACLAAVDAARCRYHASSKGTPARTRSAASA
jgi:hypothetical protein